MLIGQILLHSPYLDPPEPLLLETVTPAQIARLRDRVASTSAEALDRAREQWDRTARNIMKLHASGVRIGIGSDGGGQGGDRFIGFTAHTELENMVAAGMTPAEAIVAGTQNGAEVLGLEDELGTVAVGKSASRVASRPTQGRLNKARRGKIPDVLREPRRGQGTRSVRSSHATTADGYSNATATGPPPRPASSTGSERWPRGRQPRSSHRRAGTAVQRVRASLTVGDAKLRS